MNPEGDPPNEVEGSGARWIGYWTRRPFKFALPHLDMIPDPRTPHRETRRSNSLPDGPNKHVVFKFKRRASSRLSGSGSRTNPKEPGLPIARFSYLPPRRFVATVWAVFATDAKSRMLVKPHRVESSKIEVHSLKERFCQGIVISKQTFRTYVCS